MKNVVKNNTLDNSIRLLFITRKYPPAVGGMERLSASLYQEFSRRTETRLIAWGGLQQLLPLFLPYAVIKAVILIITSKSTHIHLGDALLSPLGVLLKFLFDIPVSVTVAGLDITFAFPPYQWIIPFCVSQLDSVICISTATKQECVARGVSQKKCQVIPIGVHPEDFVVSANRHDLNVLVNQKTEKATVLVTVGRLVQRKGVEWFIRAVFPHLPATYLYVVAGVGPENDRIYKAIRDMNVNYRVIMTGKLSQREIKILYNTADFFVMPNRKIANNPEGFGIVAIEAASCGLPVIATRVDGITDAVIEGKTGYLVEPESPTAMVNVFSRSRLSPSQVAAAVRAHFSWEKLMTAYFSVFTSLS